MIVVEPTKHGVEHGEFNSAFIHNLARVVGEGLTIYAERGHIEYLKSRNQDINCNYRILLLKKMKRKRDYLAVVAKQLCNLFEITWSSRKDEPLLFLSVDPWPRFFLLLFLWLAGRRGGVYMVFHGELEQIVGARSFVQKILFKVPILLSLKFFKSVVLNIVLGDTLLKNLKSVLADCRADSVLLPYLFNNHGDLLLGFESKSAFRVGVPGTASEKKGTQAVFELCSITDNSKEKLEYFIIGKNEFKNQYPARENVGFLASGDQLSELEFSRWMNSVDVLVLFYGENKYKLTASGAVFDALKYNKPVFALRNEYFEYVDRCSGGFIEFCDSIDEMARKILFFMCNPALQIKTKEKLGLARETLSRIYTTDFQRIFSRMLKANDSSVMLS